MLGKSFSIFESPYLVEKWLSYQVFFCLLVDIEDGNILQKKNLETSYYFSWTDANADWGWGQHSDGDADGSISLTTR
jgi:hypothetical protein